MKEITWSAKNQIGDTEGNAEVKNVDKSITYDAVTGTFNIKVE